MDCGTKELKTGLVWASTLLHSSESSPQHHEPSPTLTPTLTPALQPPPSTEFPPSENAPPSTQPRPSPFVPTPACSQPTPSGSEASQLLSRQSTAPNLTATTPFSSFSSDDAGNDSGSNNSKLCRILSVVQSITNSCRICWVNREVSRPHSTFHCPTRICSGSEWKTFKSDLQFSRGIVCYFCLALYGPPFNHVRAPLGTRQTPALCEYPDVLKELAYILFQDQSLREKVFAKLDHPPPSTMSLYKRYIVKPQDGGILGTYNAINAYLDVREEEGLLA
jgi:hypothetical protein